MQQGAVNDPVSDDEHLAVAAAQVPLKILHKGFGLVDQVLQALPQGGLPLEPIFLCLLEGFLEDLQRCRRAGAAGLHLTLPVLRPGTVGGHLAVADTLQDAGEDLVQGGARLDV